MKMGHNKFSAHDIIKNLSVDDLDKIFKYFGEEKDSKLISRNIVKQRKYKEILTEDLVNMVNSTKKILREKINQLKFFKHLEF